MENIYAQPFKRTAHLNWASCNINTRAKSQQRIKLNIDEDLYGNIFWDIPKKRWDCKRDKKSTQLFAEINMTNLEEQVLHRYGHRYNASNMDELGANWLCQKEKGKKNGYRNNLKLWRGLEKHGDLRINTSMVKS